MANFTPQPDICLANFDRNPALYIYFFQIFFCIMIYRFYRLQLMTNKLYFNAWRVLTWNSFKTNHIEKVKQNCTNFDEWLMDGLTKSRASWAISSNLRGLWMMSRRLKVFGRVFDCSLISLDFLFNQRIKTVLNFCI